MTKPIHWADGPITPEQKREIIAAGFKIIDARFKPADAVESQPQIILPALVKPRAKRGAK